MEIIEDIWGFRLIKNTLTVYFQGFDTLLDHLQGYKLIRQSYIRILLFYTKIVKHC